MSPRSRSPLNPRSSPSETRPPEQQTALAAPFARATRFALTAMLSSAALLGSAAVLVTGCGDDDARGAGSTSLEADPVAGEQTYQDFCGSCHGRDFEGSVRGPSQLDAVFAPDVTTDEDYRDAIRDGAQEQHYDFGPMPAIGSLDDQEIANVIAYVRQVQQERGLSR